MMNRKFVTYGSAAITFVLYCGTACLADTATETHQNTPSEIVKQIEGKVSNNLVFADSLGSHDLVLTTEYANDDDVETITLRAYQFVKAGAGWTREWTIKDWVDCNGLDIEAKFFPDHLTITDLNNNGIKETTVSYSMICTGDISPATIKTIMREGEHKYAVRGDSRVYIGDGRYLGGTFKSDDTLNSMPQFKNHLVTIWKAAAGVSPSSREKKHN